MSSGTEELAVQLAKLQEQVASMAASVEDVRTSVREVLSLDRALAELNILHQQQSREVAAMWDKIEAAKKDIDVVDRKTDDWINRGRGAWFVAVLLGSIAQIAVLAMISWVFTHIDTSKDQIQLLQYKVQTLEQKVQP